METARGEKWAQFAHRHGDSGLALALSIARRCTGLRLRALGEAVGGMEYKVVSMQIRRFEQRLTKEKSLAKFTHKVLNELQD